jgi:hypothetical protein
VRTKSKVFEGFQNRRFSKRAPYPDQPTQDEREDLAGQDDQETEQPLVIGTISNVIHRSVERPRRAGSLVAS